MSLVVHTSRVWYRGDDRLDITRMTGGPYGEPFAPSQTLLDGYKRERRRLVTAHDFDGLRRLWDTYRSGYLLEMSDSIVKHGNAWRKLLSRERVVLVCYCPAPDLCHRGILAELCVKFGATYAGEIECE